MTGLLQLLGVAAIVTGVTGCALLDLLFGVPPFDPNQPFPSFPTPSAQVTFTTGHATLAIDGEEIQLTQLAGVGTYEPDYGTQVTWTDGNGWYLSFYGYAEDEFGQSAYLSLDRVFDSQHWVLYDPYRCVTTTAQADADGVVGSAVCRGLQWGNFFGVNSLSGYPTVIAGEAPFDADINFEAR